MDKSNNLQFDEIDLKAVFATLWAGKFFVIFSIVFAVLIASSTLHGTVREFTVTYKLNPVTKENNTPNFSRYSGIASLAGIQLPTSSGGEFYIYQQLLTSVETSKKIFKNKELIKRLFSSEWNDNVGNYSGGKKDKKSELLSSIKRFLTGSEERVYMPPNPRRLVEYISANINLIVGVNGILIITSETSKTEDIMLLINEMTNATDAIMREKYKLSSKNPLAFYKKKLNSSRSREHREALAQLIAKEEQKLMLAASSKYFVAEPLMEPTVSLYPTTPNAKMVLMVHIIYGFIFGILVAFLLKFLRRNKL